MPEYLQSMPTKHTWTFKPRLRAKAFGWKGSHLACQRLKEAVTEIKKVDRVDPVTAGDGVVTLMERIWPAFQHIDTSSGALGGAVYWAQNELLPIAIGAPADRKVRDKWLDRLWQAIEDDGVNYLSPLEDRWGELCRSSEVASDWADRLLITRLLRGQTIEDAARTAPPPMPYQRGQFWIRRFRAQAAALCAALAALTQPTHAPDFVHRALTMLEASGWIAAHRFLFAGVRCHLLGWPRGLAPDGRRSAFSSTGAPA
jgi:hypothetical protein